MSGYNDGEVYYYQPPLTEAALEVVDSYGGWWNFMNLFGFNPMSPEDIEEARQLAERTAEEEARRREDQARR